MAVADRYQSEIRTWFQDYLKKLRGRDREWPQLLRMLIDAEVFRISHTGQPYAGRQILINRTREIEKYADRKDQHREDLTVYQLFERAHRSYGGVLTVNGDPIWLIGVQVPNQAKGRRRCADLLGCRKDGSLVVFECKVSASSDSPLYALLEGADYLGHLLIQPNFARLQQAIEDWRSPKAEEDWCWQQPQDFRKLRLELTARHSVLVLAPMTYFRRHQLTANKKQPADWDVLSDRRWTNSRLRTRLDFAALDLKCCQATLLEL